MSDLVERLLSADRFVLDPISLKPRLRNPDGPEAAARITELEAENARLREAVGAHIQADAYRDSFPDDDDDAAYLSKGETNWRLTARAWLDEATLDQCAQAAKKRVISELPNARAALGEQGVG